MPFKFHRVALIERHLAEFTTIQVPVGTGVVGVIILHNQYVAHLLIPTDAVRSVDLRPLTFYFFTPADEIPDELLSQLTFVQVDTLYHGGISYDYRYIYYR